LKEYEILSLMLLQGDVSSGATLAAAIKSSDYKRLRIQF
jgi:hypothetical protein